MQEELEHKSVVLATNTAKLTSRGLARLMSIALQRMRQSRDAPKQGKQTLKQLAKGGSLGNIEITDGNIKAFEPLARKYGVSYALKQDASSDPPRWLVFFRAKDSDALTAAFKEFSAKIVKRESDKPSVRETIRKFRETAKTVIPNRIRHKRQEGPER